MSALNAIGHVLVAEASGPDELWDLMDELANRVRPGSAVTVHSMSRGSGQPRYCVHPHSLEGVEVRHNDLGTALLKGAIWLARQLPDDELWRRV